MWDYPGLTAVFNRSPALGAGALKEAAAAAAKKKEASSESRSEKKRKSALEEIIEVEAGRRDASERPRRSRRDGCPFPDGGEEEEARAAAEDGELAAAQHRGQGRHQEARRALPQEEGGCRGNTPAFFYSSYYFLVSGRWPEKQIIFISSTFRSEYFCKTR